MLRSSVSCCKCFVFQRYVQRVMRAWPGLCGKGRGDLVAADGAHSAPGSCERDVFVLIQASRSCPHGERRGPGGRSGGRNGVHVCGQGEADGSRVRVRDGARQTGDRHARAVAIRWISGH
jgi:hypothetical protein